VAADATMMLSPRNQARRGIQGGFRDSAIALGDVRVGNFVVVELSDELGTATLVTITLSRGGGS
jgi:hypothetical protein